MTSAAPEYLLGIHNFSGRSEDELDIARGDYIEVLEDDSAFNDTWYIGRNLRTYATGLFPRPFTVSVQSLPPDIAYLAAQAPPIMLVEDDHDKPTSEPSPAASSAPPSELSRQLSQLSMNNARSAPLIPPGGPNSAPHSVATPSTPNSPPRGPPLYAQPPNNYQSEIDRAIYAMEASPPRETGLSRRETDPLNNHSVDTLDPVDPINHSIDPINRSIDPINRSIDPINHSIDPTNRSIDPINHSIDPINHSIDTINHPINHAIDPINHSASPANPIAHSALPDPARVLSWTPAQVAAHFAALNIVEADKFVAHRITGTILLEMDRETLKEIDILSFGPRFEIEREIRALRQQIGYAPVPHSPLSPQNLVPPSPYLPSPSPNLPAANLPRPANWHPYANFSNLTASSPSFGTLPSQDSASSYVPGGAVYGHHNKPSEEELTGSLNSTFSMRRGHHRHTSSATSRYSLGANARALPDDFEHGLQPALLERPRDEFAGDREAKHRRNPSRGTDEQHWRNNSHIQNEPGHLRTYSRGDRTLDRAEKHRRGASLDSKQAHRNSVLSLLSVSPKKSMQHLTGSPKVASPSHTAHLASPQRSNLAAPAVGPNDSLQLLNGQVISNGQVYEGPIMTNSGNSHSQNTSQGALKAMMRPGAQKQMTSAFQEGIQHTTALSAAKTADKAGWLHKRGGSGLGVWSKRYFTLHGTRLSYFATFKDTKERGLIDITGHRVVPVRDKDLLVSLSAAGMGAGRHCFKLVPPGPGYKKGVAFTAPRVHYFAADSEDEMRDWQTHLLTATIERDESAPVTSTCKLPTMSLPRAQELMAERLKTKGDIGSLIN